MCAFGRSRLANFIETANACSASNLLLPRRLFATFVTSSSQTTQKGRQRLSREERLKLVKDFVEKYRTMNEWKYPTVTLTRREVGGSYYTIKYLLQLLQDESKLSDPAIERNIEPHLRETVVYPNDSHRENISPSLDHSKDMPQFSILQCNTSQEHLQDSKDISTKVGVNVPITSFASLENDCQKPSSELKATITSVEREADKIRTEILQGSSVDSLKPEDDRDSKRVHIVDSLPKKETIWRAVKSLADGILKFWKNP